MSRESRGTTAPTRHPDVTRSWARPTISPSASSADRFVSAVDEPSAAVVTGSTVSLLVGCPIVIALRGSLLFTSSSDSGWIRPSLCRGSREPGAERRGQTVSDSPDTCRASTPNDHRGSDTPLAHAEPCHTTHIADRASVSCRHSLDRSFVRAQEANHASLDVRGWTHGRPLGDGGTRPSDSGLSVSLR